MFGILVCNIGAQIIGGGRIGRHSTSCVFSVFTAHFQGFCLLFITTFLVGGGWGGGLNSVRPSHILSSAHLRAGNDDDYDHDHDHYDED